MEILGEYFTIGNLLLTLLLIFVVGFLIKYCWKRRRIYYYSAKIEGPFGLPFLGTIHPFLKGKDAHFTKTMELVEKYRPIGKIWFGSHFYVMISEVEDVEKLMKRCLAKEQMYEFLKPALGHGILTAKLSTWGLHRKILNQTFNQTILNSYFAIIIKHSNSLIIDLKENYANIQTDIFKRYGDCTLKTICDTCIGVDSSEWNQQDEFMRWLAQGQALIGNRLLNPLYHSDIVWKLFGSENAVAELCAKAFAFVREIVFRKKQLLENENCGDTKYKDFLSCLIKVTEEENKWSNEELVEETVTMIIAGSDTTAVTLSFTTIMLAMHQDVQRRAYQEMLDIFENNTREPTLDDLSRMVYLECVIKETMRLFPVGPVLFRKVLEDVVIRDTVIPEGSNLLIPVHHIHRSAKYWPNPLKFDPDRFKPEEVEKRPRYCYMPFSIPPRNCIGMRFAMMSMKVYLSNVLRNFQIVSTQYESIETIRLHVDVIISAPDGYGVTLKPRTEKI
ncbi:cytochrome P450 4C1-like isoform X3 [Tenebrio molitor]